LNLCRTAAGRGNARAGKIGCGEIAASRSGEVVFYSITKSLRDFVIEPRVGEQLRVRAGESYEVGFSIRLENHSVIF
jgi:hypothetical protein